MDETWHIVWFTLGSALLSMVVILPIGLPLAWLLARKEWPGKSIVETIIALPLVMPPVATGLILLKVAGRRGFIGSFLHEHFDMDIIFTWRAVVLALAVMSFPLLVRSLRVALEGVSPRLEGVARTLGASPLRVFFTVTLPLAARGIIAGVVLAFARALGEFGATVLIAGNIPGRTSTLAVSTYLYIQLGQDDAAWKLVAISISFAFVAVWLSEWLGRKQRVTV